MAVIKALGASGEEVDGVVEIPFYIQRGDGNIQVFVSIFLYDGVDSTLLFIGRLDEAGKPVQQQQAPVFVAMGGCIRFVKVERDLWK
ncbi:MAG: hypothetical protein OCC46_10095 [Pseudodesulfovibrio sp.]